MFIQTENTPNPNTLKFIPGINVTGGEPINFVDRNDCAKSLLAGLLFEIENVMGVFLGFDFITITKDVNADWNLMKPHLLVTITEYLASKKPILKGENTNSQVDDNDSEIIKQIKELIETRVRPAVAQDGGDITFREFTDGILKLELHGACSGCPSSTVTLKDGIENMMKYYVPEIIAVESV